MKDAPPRSPLRPVGPAGLAILGSRGRELVQRTVVLYDTSKKPHVTETIGAEFALFPQENLYATFYSSDGQGWSTLLKSYGDWEASPRTPPPPAAKEKKVAPNAPRC